VTVAVLVAVAVAVTVTVTVLVVGVPPPADCPLLPALAEPITIPTRSETVAITELRRYQGRFAETGSCGDSILTSRDRRDRHRF
jgi:hypothetical protein